MNDDLRSFLEFVRSNSAREYLCVDKQVSPDWEPAAIVATLEKKMRMPLIEFTDVQGSEMAMVTNICASLPRIAKSLGIAPAELDARLVQAYEKPIAPKLWQSSETPPVRECVDRGEAVDLYRLPQIRATAGEEAGYLSAAAVIANDPRSGIANISYHRLMITGRNQTAIFMTPDGHLDQIFQQNTAKNQSTPVVVFIGAHPLWALGSLAAGGPEVDELAVIGGLLGYPLDITPSLVEPDLPVPARAEIVLEGFIRHDRQVEEGPYGEALGFMSNKEPQPLFEVEIMSTRDNPLFQDIVAGHIEHLSMTGTAVRVHLQRSVLEKYPAVTEIHTPGPMTLYIRLAEDKQGLDVNALMHEILQTQRYVKQVVVFDADVELRNAQQVQWALATMVQADRDIIMLPGQPGNGIDPSEHDGKTTKWGIDATAKAGSHGLPEKNQIPEAALAKVDIDQLLKR